MSGTLQAIFQNQRSFGPVPSQQAFTTAGTYTWIAPTLVTSVSVVAIGGGEGGGASFNGDGGDSYFCSTSVVKGGGAGIGGSPGTFTGDGGGNGGCVSWGGGGAGGYTGRGGNGSAQGPTSLVLPAANSGGAAGGNGSSGYGDGGGGVGILGKGATATSDRQGGSGGTNGTPGASGAGGVYGGGQGGNACRGAGKGGGLGWKNNITVVPGNSYTVVAGAGGGNAGKGAVRIIWPGSTRSFPSTCTGDL